MRIEEFLKDSSPDGTLLILDYDGTLHKGLFPPLFKGRANADIGVMLLLRKLWNPLATLRLLSSLIDIFLLELMVSEEYRRGRLSLSDAEEKLIRRFASIVLGRCEAPEIARAADSVAKLCHDDAWPVLRLLQTKTGMTVVSKSFELLLEKVAALADARHGVYLEFHGVRLGDSGEIQADSIISKLDKGRKTREIIGKGHFKKALVIGDTEEDIAMLDAAAEELGRENVLFIALSPKDARIAGAADIRAKSWKDIESMLQ